SAGHALWTALELAPAGSTSMDALRAAGVASLRASCDADALRESAKVPLVAAMRSRADALMRERKVDGAACALEKTLLAAAQSAELSTAQRRRLWSQVVEVQKRLDIYDPGDGAQ